MSIAAAQVALARHAPLVAHPYLFRPRDYLESKLNVMAVGPFVQIVEDVATAWLWMHQRQAMKEGRLAPHQEGLRDWDGETPIPNVFAVQGGHKQGKSFFMTALAFWVVHVSPRIVGCIYAPEVKQASRITWRYVDGFATGRYGGSRGYVARMRQARGGGRTAPKLVFGLSRAVTTQATKAGVSVQGSHEAVGLHYMEEAEGITQQEVFDAVRTLVADGISLWFLCANPATATSPFARVSGDRVKRYELDCLKHPNVVTGEVVVPGAVTREWIEAQMDGRSAWAVPVEAEDEERSTFQLDWKPGQWWMPRPPWWWRVWGQPPPTTAADAAVSAAILRKAVSRDAVAIAKATSPKRATIGVDCARGGEDAGQIARLWRGVAEIRRELHTRKPSEYVAAIIEELEVLLAGGCEEVEVRVDAGGAFGAWVEDLRALDEHIDMFALGARVREVNFGAAPYDNTIGANWITCAYLDAGEALRTVALATDDPQLEEDLTWRRVSWVVKSDGHRKRDVRQLERKEEFRRRYSRSPDKGDAMALCLARWFSMPVDFAGADSRRWGGPGQGKVTKQSHEAPVPGEDRDSDIEDPTSRWGR